jgi:ribonuclease T2
MDGFPPFTIFHKSSSSCQYLFVPLFLITRAPSLSPPTQRNDGSYPSSCTNEALDPDLLADLSNDLAAKWPNVKAMSGAEHASFWSHEWSKHGTCSGMDQRTYFATALGLLLPTPPIVGERKGSVVSREELVSGYADGSSSSSSSSPSDAVFVCKHGYLSEVRVCYAKGGATGSGLVGERMSCPGTIVREDNCGERIEIASFDDGTPKSAIE